MQDKGKKTQLIVRRFMVKGWCLEGNFWIWKEKWSFCTKKCITNYGELARFLGNKLSSSSELKDHSLLTQIDVEKLSDWSRLFSILPNPNEGVTQCVIFKTADKIVFLNWAWRCKAISPVLKCPLSFYPSPCMLILDLHITI